MLLSLQDSEKYFFFFMKSEGVRHSGRSTMRKCVWGGFEEHMVELEAEMVVIAILYLV